MALDRALDRIVDSWPSCPFMAIAHDPCFGLWSVWRAFIVWIILLIKANQGQMYKLPLIGDLAEKQANAM